MSLLQQVPSLTAADAQELVRRLYGRRGSATPLPGERDRNLRIASDGEEFVLKVANAAASRALLEAENEALRHAAAADGPRVPAPVPGLDGAPIQSWSGHAVRLLTWVPGRPLASLAQRSLLLLEDVGRQLGRLDRALASFEHPAVHRTLEWDLLAAPDIIREHLPLVADGDLQRLVRDVFDRAHAAVAGAFPALPRSVVHNDANDYNVLVDGTDARAARDQRVAGIIDFGDLVHTISVADPAIAVSYAMLDAAAPLDVAGAIVRGYHAQRPLSDAEVDALWPLALIRLCVSVCMAACHARQRPADGYVQISQGPIARTLPALAAIDWAGALAALRAARDAAAALRRRRGSTVRNLSVAYDEPLALVRGSMQYVFDKSGRRYLDAYNNVPHVGHSHPRVAEAAAAQLRVLNTNTRYLHDSLARFAERLTATLPPPLGVCCFVNSGSEANELALRLARAHTRGRDVIVLEHAYHGNTTTLTDISPYKFNGPGGEGAPAWVHVAPQPDVYRGPFGKDDPSAGERYAHAVARLVATIQEQESGLCGFIAETCPSVGGQIILPPGYLRSVYASVRAAGGVCIADEVQTAYGRLGSGFYAFEDHGVVPDIVVLGKPIGNGYPLGAVVTTDAIAASFDNGMEFFSTFGGSTVSCAVGLAVLDVVQAQDLQRHAAQVGGHLLAGLRALAERYPLIGDVRGAGLFVGVELVRDPLTRDPATTEAAFVVNRMRDMGVLIGTDGPFHNVLKIRPPMPFDVADAELLIDRLDEVLGESRPASRARHRPAPAGR